MPDVEALKIRKWADTGDRTDPDDSALTPALNRAEGWPSEWSATDGEKLRRRVMNQVFRELTGAAVDIMSRGISEWDTTIDYPQYAFVQSGGDPWRATVATGPTIGNDTDPQTALQTIWERLVGVNSEPDAPAAPTGTVGQGALTWTWNCPRDGGQAVTSFEFRSRRSGSAWSSPITTQHAFNQATGLVNGAVYEAQVRARNSVGRSAYSATGSATPLSSVPGQVFGLVASAGDTEVDLEWLEPDDGGSVITGYHVEWREESQGWSGGRRQTSTNTSDTVAGLANNSVYFFRVRAINVRGNGSYSNQVMATPDAAAVTPPTPVSTAPDAPGTPQGFARDGSIAWAFDCPSDNGSDITGYALQWRAQGSGWSGNVLSLDIPYASVSGLTNGTTYEARARATNGEGTGAWSATGSTTPASERREFTSDDTFVWPFSGLTRARVEVRGGEGGGGGGGGGGGAAERGHSSTEITGGGGGGGGGDGGDDDVGGSFGNRDGRGGGGTGDGGDGAGDGQHKRRCGGD